MKHVLFALLAVYGVALVVGNVAVYRYIVRERKRPRGLHALILWATIATIWYLDHGRTVHAQHAAVFGFVVNALGFIVDVFTTVGAVVADTLVAIVSYLASAVVFLLKTLGNVILSTGSIFAKVWDGLKIAWNDVIKPGLVWLDKAVTRVRTWLKDTFGPVFTFLRHVRDAFTAIYDRFVKPILNVIDFVHRLDTLLQALHINILKGLDSTLQGIEQRIDGVLSWIYGKLNEIVNTLTTIVTVDGFFQRYTLLRSLARDVAFSARIMNAARMRPLTDLERYTLHRATNVADAGALVSDLDDWWAGDSNDLGDAIDSVAARGEATWDSFA